MTLAELLRLSPVQMRAIALVGQRMMEAGAHDRAEQVFGGLVAASPYDGLYRTRFAAALFARGHLEEALQEYTRALELNRGDLDARTGRGEVLLRLGRSAEG